jgi:hypothetical protein
MPNWWHNNSIAANAGRFLIVMALLAGVVLADRCW